MPEPTHKRQLTLTVYATPLMTPTTELGLSIRLSMFELRETGDWDIFLVGCAHPGFAPYLARIRCPKVRCVHPSKWSFWLPASVPKKTPACIVVEMTLACIRFQVTIN